MSWKRFWDKWSNWELWPMKVRYFPIAPVWLWYSLRSWSFWFFTPSNPTLTFGGFEGERKSEMYEQLLPGIYPNTIYIHPGSSFQEVQKAVFEHGFAFPFIVKPDIGRGGVLFRVIENERQLKTYHQRVPVDYMIQSLVKYPVEFSVFYYRYPDQQKGVITGFLRKELLEVMGNGKNTLWELILKHPIAKHRFAEMRIRHEEHLNEVIAEGKKYYLSHAANLSRGGRFINLKNEIDEQIHHVFDDLNHFSKTFYYGRYDLKAASLDDLKSGKNFSILEYNGSGAEPNHIYNSNYTLLGAYAEIIKHWKVLFEISRYNYKKGIRYWPFLKGLRFLKGCKKHYRLIKKSDNF
ncbi:MAG: hypothetical protein ABR502_05090 [Chitinophagaceae bacterium]